MSLKNPAHPLQIGLELVHAVLLDLLRQAPAKVGHHIGRHPLHRRPAGKNRSKTLVSNGCGAPPPSPPRLRPHGSQRPATGPKTRYGSPVLSLSQDHIFLNLHDLDVIQVPRRALYDPALGIHLALLHDPRLRPTDELLREPLGHRARLLDQPRRLERAFVSQRPRDDVAREDVRRVRVRVAQEVGEGDDLPGVAVRMRKDTGAGPSVFDSAG